MGGQHPGASMGMLGHGMGGQNMPGAQGGMQSLSHMSQQQQQQIMQQQQQLQQNPQMLAQMQQQHIMRQRMIQQAQALGIPASQMQQMNPQQLQQFMAAQQNQQAFQSAVDTWSKTVEQTVSAIPANPTQIDPQQVVNQVFDFAERMLAMQRDFTTNLLANTVALSSRVTGSDRTPEA